MALALICLGALPAVLAQTLTIRPIKDFKVPDYHSATKPGETNKLKSLLTGKEARPQPDGPINIKEPRIDNFHEDGRPDLVMKSPQCFFDYRTKVATSTNTLQVVDAEGRFSIEGEGFYWRQTNSMLIISNKVRTVLSKKFVNLNPVKP